LFCAKIIKNNNKAFIMLNKHNIKMILIESVDADYIAAFSDRTRLKATLFKVLTTDDNTMLEKKCLSKMIENHIKECEIKDVKEQAVDPLSLKTIDELTGAFAAIAKSHTRDDAFKDAFTVKMVDRINGQLKEASDQRNAIVYSYLANMGSMGQTVFNTLGFEQVYYNEDEDYNIDYNDFTVEETEGVHKMLAGVIERGSKPNDVRLLGGNRIAVDFESFGYHGNVTGEMDALIAVVEKIDSLREEYSSVSDVLYEHSAIEFVLIKIAEEVENFYGKEIADSMRDNGGYIHSAYFAKMTNRIDDGVSIEASELDGLLKDGPFGDIVFEHASQCLKAAGESIAHVIQWKTDTLRRRFAVVDFDTVDKEFDERVKKAIDLKESGDELGFKRHYNSLGVFERMSVDLEFGVWKEESRESEKTPELGNVVSMF
jgi:hypothetical protein